MNFLGTIEEDGTIPILFCTNDGSGGAVAPSDAFEAADVVIVKDDGTVKSSTNGVTMTSPFNSTVGLHRLVIDTSNDTSDVGFWAAGHDYAVILDPDTETVDSQTVVAPIGSFSIENRVTKTVKGNVDGSVASVTAGVTVSTNNDKSGYSISGTLQTLDALDTQQDARHAETKAVADAIQAVTDNLPDSGALTTLANNISAILTDTGTNGVVISEATAQAVADEVLKRSVSHVEGASLDQHTMAAIILAIMQSLRDINTDTWTIYRTDGSTTQFTKTLTTNELAEPVVGVS